LTQDNNSQAEKVAKSFEVALNSHGYSFQEAVLNAAQKLAGTSKSSWYFVEREFPVEVQGYGTRIDFILRHYNDRVPIYLLAECKRTNPAYSNWGFAWTEFISRDRSFEPFIVERLKRRDINNAHLMNQPPQFYITSKLTRDKKVYNIAFDVKSDQRGDSGGAPSGRSIEEAASQVLRDLNGMAQFLSVHNQTWQSNTIEDAILLPVIFTTAELWTTDIAPKLADINTGKLAIPTTSLKKQTWLPYQYHMSPGLKHSLSSVIPGDTLGEIMDLEYVRTIPIVSPSGIADFLDWSSNIVIWR
jgi:hypothetical protein